eukprot:jgi/Hompol1/2880/HPOL_003056-RA
MSELTEYERQRQENILRNQKVLEELGLLQKYEELSVNRANPPATRRIRKGRSSDDDYDDDKDKDEADDPYSCHHCRQRDDVIKIRCNHTIRTASDGEPTLCFLFWHDRCLNVYDQTIASATRTKAETGIWACPRCSGACICSFCRVKRSSNGILREITETDIKLARNIAKHHGS